MLHAARKDDILLLRSMGKSFRIVAIATDNDEANEHMRKHPEAAVIACFGPFIFMADKYDGGQS